MNIVNSGTSYQVYDNSVQTYKLLPNGCYQLEFNQMTGFSLRAKPNMEVLEEKIYGNIEYNVDKVLKSFSLANRNFGVILSGEKGTGKSLFARVLANKANKLNLPLIIIPANYPGLSSFISSIDQECIILFDEFEKNFPCDYDDDFENDSIGADGGVQDNLLSLFDGLDGGKKLFIITCNNTYKLSTFFLNRPGRFHYHFQILPPNAIEIKEYLQDKLDKQYYSLIDSIINLSYCGTITYDCLRALVFEINQGYDFEEILDSLNLTRDRTIELDLVITLSNGKLLYGTHDIRLFDENYQYSWVSSREGTWTEAKIGFKPIDINIIDGNFELDVNKVILKATEFEDSNSESNLNIIDIKLAKSTSFINYKYIV